MAGTIPLSQYRKNVRGLIGDSDYDLTLVDQAINWFINDVHNNNRIRYMETNDQLYASAGDSSIEFPDDMQTMLIMNLISPQIYSLKDLYIEYDRFMQTYPGYLTYNRSQIMYWTDFSNAMRFAAPALADSTIDLDYLRRPVPMVDATDTTDMPDAYEELISKGSLARLMEVNEDYAEAAQERNNLDPQLITFVRNEGRGGIKIGPTVMNSNRGRTRSGGAWRADKDF